MSREDEFVLHLCDLDVPIFTGRPGATDEFTGRPKGWSTLTPEDNAERIAAANPGDPLNGLMGDRVAVVDIDPRNGGDVDKVRALLDGIGVTIFADVLTPGGGRHFYIAGHPNLATVHATADRPGLIGYPGVDVQSHGAVAYLPGTRRPKYDGGGYPVMYDNLTALADGGDPDGGRAFAGWVADNRMSTPETFAPAPPWTGEVPDERQAAYLAGVLRNMHKRIAAMAPETGRNTAVYNAALACGNYVAGAGMDESEAMSVLLDASTANHLVRDEGKSGVLASIRSGIRNGRKRPRQVPPEPAPWPPELKPEPSVSAISLDAAHRVFTRWLGNEYDLDVLDTVLAVAAVNQLDGDPVWLLVVSGSGAAKTETVAPLARSGAVVTSTITSEGALLSGTSRRERTKDATGGLLRKMGDSGVLVVKDVTSILSMNRDARGAVLAALREVYDGYWERNLGSDGGQSLSWSGRLVVIGAVTTAWDRAHDVVASMGDRFVLIRLDSTKGRVSSGQHAIANTGDEVAMRAELGAAVAGVLAGVDTSVDLSLTEVEASLILAWADIVTLARTGVEHDYRGDVIDAHAPEMPTRFAKQLAQVMRGGMALGIDRDRLLRITARCAADSMPPLRMAALCDLRTSPNSSTTEVRRRIDKPRSTVDRTLQALHMLGLLACAEEVSVTEQRTTWRYTLADGVDTEALEHLQLSQICQDLHAPASPAPETEHNKAPETDTSLAKKYGGGDISGTTLGDSAGDHECPDCGTPLPRQLKRCSPCQAAYLKPLYQQGNR